MDGATRELVRNRAELYCEYCRLPQKHSEAARHVEHIVAKKHGGSDQPDNLALACHRYNLYKGPNLTGIDPSSGQFANLFNRRCEAWPEHFSFEGDWIVGLTPTGRTTVQVLAMNDPRRRELRREIGRFGRFA